MLGNRAVAGDRRRPWLGRGLLLLAGATALVALVLLVKPAQASYRLGPVAHGVQCRAPLAAAIGMPSPRAGGEAFVDANLACQGAEERAFHAVLVSLGATAALAGGGITVRAGIQPLRLEPMRTPRRATA